MPADQIVDRMHNRDAAAKRIEKQPLLRAKFREGPDTARGAIMRTSSTPVPASGAFYYLVLITVNLITATVRNNVGQLIHKGQSGRFGGYHETSHRSGGMWFHCSRVFCLDTSPEFSQFVADGSIAIGIRTARS
jgi:hypothetical protein